MELSFRSGYYPDEIPSSAIESGYTSFSIASDSSLANISRKRKLSDNEDGATTPDAPSAPAPWNRLQPNGRPQLWWSMLTMLVDPRFRNAIAWTGQGLKFRIVDRKRFADKWDEVQGRERKMDCASVFRTILGPRMHGIINVVNKRLLLCEFKCEEKAAEALEIDPSLLHEYIRRHNTTADPVSLIGLQPLPPIVVPDPRRHRNWTKTSKTLSTPSSKPAAFDLPPGIIRPIPIRPNITVNPCVPSPPDPVYPIQFLAKLNPEQYVHLQNALTQYHAQYITMQGILGCSSNP